MTRRALLAALLLAAAACDNGRQAVGPASDGASVVVKGRTLRVRLLLTERERRFAPERMEPLPEDRAVLMGWARPRYVKLESANVRPSFDVAFLDPSGRVVDRQGLVGRADEGVASRAEAAWALLAAEGALSELADGDTVELSPEARAAAPQDLPAVVFDGVAARAELALDERERQLGLMHRPRMSPEEGMLFAYASDGPRSFWMKNTLIPLDIAFIRDDGTVVNVVDMPMYPNPRFPPDPYPTADSEGPARYVLEMNQGWFRRHGLVDAEGRPKAGLKASIPPEAARGAFDR